jgi:hypothetical protein
MKRVSRKKLAILDAYQIDCTPSYTMVRTRGEGRKWAVAVCRAIHKLSTSKELCRRRVEHMKIEVTIIDAAAEKAVRQ